MATKRLHINNLIILLLVLSASYHSTESIIGRDLVLTPKQGLQLNGKSIYYEEAQHSQTDRTTAWSNENKTSPALEILPPPPPPPSPPIAAVSPQAQKNVETTKRVWERTLKHVTYVTLFTNAAVGAVAGNISQLRDYNEFMSAPYIIAEEQLKRRQEPKFGDIVRLASGRLEQTNDHHKSFRFIEGSCSNSYHDACDASRIWAFWQVQKIRHRDDSIGAQRRYRYEMKFSVTPLRPTNGNSNNDIDIDSADVHGALHKRKVDERGHTTTKQEHWSLRPWRTDARLQQPQHYIQKEDDYPQSFGPIVYNDERQNTFADRRLDATDQRRAAVPVPQSTFIHGIFQPPPPPPHPSRLNIGEYLQDTRYAAVPPHQRLPPPPPAQQTAPNKATPKIEIFPNIFNLGHFLTPTTFRPNYQMKFARPEIYHHGHHIATPQQHELPQRYHQTPAGVAAAGNVDAGIDAATGNGVTHHFHHHFYMPPPSLPPLPTRQIDIEELHFVAQQPHDDIGFYKSTTPATPTQQESTKQLFFPSSTASSDVSEADDDVEDSIGVIEVTPLTLARKPQIQYGQASRYQAAKVPLLIYAGNENENAKPFKHSEPLDVQVIRYSEPDPLYINQNESFDVTKAQLEAPTAPDTRQPVQKLQTLLTTERPIIGDENREKHVLETEKIVKNATTNSKTITTVAPNVRIFTTGTPDDGRSQEISSAKDRYNSIKQQRDEIIIPTTTTTTLIHNSSGSSQTTKAATAAVAASNTAANFVSTSTNATPLRVFSRYRGTLNNSTAEQTTKALTSHKRITAGSSTTTSTTAEPVVLKWKPRRRGSSSSTTASIKLNTNELHDDIDATTTTTTTTKLTKDNKPKSSYWHEAKIKAPQKSKQTLTSAPEILVTSASTTTPTPTPMQIVQSKLKSGSETYEVLTQKSVSKSVSIKVGENGEEIPIIVDDEENEVKHA